MTPGATVRRWFVVSGIALAWTALPSAAAFARSPALPEIRAHAANPVPRCVTPSALMRFLLDRNPKLDARFHDIAALYKQHGNALRVRWDYAFFQMVLETNYLTYRAGPGRWGDVRPRQNNFAGLGTTGGGVAGDNFPDVSTGVLAHLQHLVAYSGERVANPAASRTREQQDDIVERSKALKRPVTFRDLTRRWATDRHYATSIAFIAERFRSSYCHDNAVAQATDPEPRTSRIQFGGDVGIGDGQKAMPGARLASAATASLAPSLLRGPQPAERPRTTTCRVWTASYGGGKNILIRSASGAEVHYTALQVLDGFENSLSESFIRAHAPGGEPIGEFASRKDALARAFELCPDARTPRP